MGTRKSPRTYDDKYTNLWRQVHVLIGISTRTSEDIRGKV